jgi:peptidoglycan/LPS O-acetylase OafA/YrhL
MIDPRPNQNRENLQMEKTVPETVTRGTRGIPSLTGIRGVAAVWVFLTHYQAVMASYLHSPEINDNRFLYNGFRGVDLFFVLSGFILMHVHADDFRVPREPAIRRFYVLRFFRVYPLNAAVLLVLVPVTFLMPDFVSWVQMDHGVPIPWHDRDFSAPGFVQSLLLAQTWTVVKPGEWNGPAWSLSAEVFGYAFFPLLAFILVRGRSALVCAAAAFASLSILMVLLAVGHHADDSPTGTFGLVRMVFCFSAGVCLARCYQLASGMAGSAAAIALVSCGCIAGCLMLPAANMFVVFGFGGLIFALAWQRGIVNAALASPPSMFLGRISFSLYMVHYIPLKLSLYLSQTVWADATLGFRVLCLVGTAGLCLLLAMITYRGVELPMQRYARVVLRQRRAAVVGPANTVTTV